ncbi:MAG: hypothetical protein M3R00_06020, partial [Pseudomonadota bacterium]|nr:hypothetical protein [Pseudomonadota bacterium]
MIDTEVNDNERIVTERKGMGQCHKCFESLSWTGVVAGALVATGLSFLLTLFDAGIGLTAIDHTERGITTVVVGGLIGMLIGAIVTMFIAGCVAGYVGRTYSWNRHSGVLQGFLAWCLALVIMLALFSANLGTLSYGSTLLADNITPSPAVRLTTDENVPAVSNVQASQPQATINTEKAANTAGKG